MGVDVVAGTGAERALLRMVHAVVFAPSSTTHSLQQMLHVHMQEQFARISWADRHAHKMDGSDDDSDEDESSRADAAIGAPADPTAPPEDLRPLARMMRALAIDSLSIEVGTQMLFSQIGLKIRQTATKQFETAVLDGLKSWSDRVVMPWLAQLLGHGGGSSGAAARPGDDSDGGLGQLYEQWRTRLDFHLYETLGNVRIVELFDIVAWYPDSLPALEDLQACLHRTRQHNDLIVSLKASLRKRLLIPGATTADIIEQFVSTVKALRKLEPALPAGVSLAAVSTPIKEYLRGRKDTIRCVVTMLTEDSGDHQELLREADGTVGMTTALTDDNDSSDGEDFVDVDAVVGGKDIWMPEPPEAMSSGAGREGGQDIIAMLVRIYGSTKVFVIEYRDMLAAKLLASPDFDMDREYRTLELLKQRFGEASLIDCEVMLKDVKNSMRVSANIGQMITKHKSQQQAGRPHDADPSEPTVDCGDDSCLTNTVQPMIISQVRSAIRPCCLVIGNVIIIQLC